ncbi:MAG: VTC domain-containing protein [Thermoanaerobaculia bacterium]
MPALGFPREPLHALDHEVKFVFPGASLAVARTILQAACRRELPHAASLVETIYFDGRRLESLAEKLASDYRKTKIRLRWYDRSAAVWLEVKRRVGSRREKFRTRIGPTEDAGRESLDGRELSLSSLDSPALATLPRWLVGVGEAVPAGLAPAVHLAYRRERFVEPASGLRISLDSEIEVVRIADWAAGLPGIRRVEGGLRSPYLVEIKGASRDLPPALAALAALGGRRESFSKYSFCLLD